ncbi:MAG TPA: SgcJ/EcaC family oxidoreductase [Prolixibacteraceae bacterium]|jgi:uncharacterized protein (TIGR02246 family)
MKTLLLLLVLDLLTCMGKGQDLDKNAVKNVVIQFQDDFNEGSFQNAASYTTADWEHINPNGAISKGRENVLKEVRAVHLAFLKGVHMNIETMEIRFLVPTVAVADVIHLMDDFTTPDHKSHLHERQIKTYVIVKQEGKWLLAHDQNTVIAP